MNDQAFTLVTDTAYSAGLTSLITYGLVVLGGLIAMVAVLFIRGWSGMWVALAFMAMGFGTIYAGAYFGAHDVHVNEEQLEQQVQAEGIVLSAEPSADDQAVVVRLVEDPSRTLEFPTPDTEVLTRWESHPLTATCTGLDDPQALTECRMGEAPAEPETAPDGRAVERTTEPYTG